jgi:hypothetical protein
MLAILCPPIGVAKAKDKVGEKPTQSWRHRRDHRRSEESLRRTINEAYPRRVFRFETVEIATNPSL